MKRDGSVVIQCGVLKSSAWCVKSLLAGLKKGGTGMIINSYHSSVATILVFVATSFSVASVPIDQYTVSHETEDLAFERLLYTQNRHMSFTQSFNGKLLEGRRSDSKLPIVEFFTHSVIRHELQLTVEQVKAIQEHFKAFQNKEAQVRDRRKVGSKSTSESYSGSYQEAKDIEEIAKSLHRFFLDARSVLSASQNVRLKEIQWQFIVFRNGLESVMNNSDAIQALGLGPSIGSRINFELPADFESRLRDTEKRLVDTAIDNWLFGLSLKQRESFDRQWKEALSGPGSLGQLVWFLEYERHAPFQPLVEDESFEFSLTRPAFLHGADGNIVVVESLGRESLSERAKLHAFEEMIGSPLFQDLMAVDKMQLDEISQLSNTFFKHEQLVIDGTAEQFDLPTRGGVTIIAWTGQTRMCRMYTWPEDMAAITLEINGRLETNARETRKQMLEVLFEFQRETLKLNMTRLDVLSRGPWADFLHGGLDKEIELTELQRSQLRTRRTEIVETLQKESRMFANKVLERLMNDLPQSVCEKLRKSMGKPVQSGHRDLNILRSAWLSSGDHLDYQIR